MIIFNGMARITIIITTTINKYTISSGGSGTIIATYPIHVIMIHIKSQCDMIN